jgi:hypothetical protein
VLTGWPLISEMAVVSHSLEARLRVETPKFRPLLGMLPYGERILIRFRILVVKLDRIWLGRRRTC